MTGATMFSGIGAPEVAMPHIAWKWCAEIDQFASALLNHHRPNIPNLGDVNAPDFTERASSYGPIDIFVYGHPCQSFSVAGGRQSLSDDRGQLSLRSIEVVNAIDPRIIVAENVPGWLSTQDNAFGCFLGGLVGADAPLIPAAGQRWTDAGMVAGPRRTAAWRILDAQYFRLAQRRRRVFVVSCRTGDGTNPGAILFEPESLRRHFAPSRASKENIAGTLGGGSGQRGWCDNTDRMTFIPETAYCLNGKGGTGRHDAQANETFVAHTLRGDGFDASEDGTGRGTPLVPVGFSETGQGWISEGISALRSSQACKPTSGMVLTNHPAVAFTERGREKGRTFECQDDLAYCLTNPGSGGRTHSRQLMDQNMAVRRLTPRECERLQGFPDGYTLIPYRSKPASDGPRYRAIGNSMAVTVMRWIGERIEAVERAMGLSR